MKKSLWFNHQALLTLLVLNMSVSYIVRFMVYDRLHELAFRVLALHLLHWVLAVVSMFIWRSSSEIVILLLYVDDIIFTGSSLAVLRSLISRFSSQFSMKDLGDIHYFLGIEACRTPQHLLLTQSKYVLSLLSRLNMNNCKPASTLVASGKKLSLYDGTLLPDPSQYRSIVGALTFTRPDITYAVQQVCQFMHVPRDVHFQAVKRILRYLKRTIGYGVRFIS
jgi:hypothetical protein